MKKLFILAAINLSVFGIAFGQISPAPKVIIETTTNSKADEMPELVGLKGQNAPVFTNQTINGTELSIEKMRGQIVVINLWGTFCAPCIEEMPKLNSLVETYKDKPVVFLAPAPDDKAVLEGFLKKYPFNYQVIPNGINIIEKYAPHKKAEKGLGDGGFLMLLPTHLVIDQTGVVTYHEWGFRKDTIEKISGEIEKLLPPSKSK